MLPGPYRARTQVSAGLCLSGSPGARPPSLPSHLLDTSAFFGTRHLPPCSASNITSLGSSVSLSLSLSMSRWLPWSRSPTGIAARAEILTSVLNAKVDCGMGVLLATRSEDAGNCYSAPSKTTSWSRHHGTTPSAPQHSRHKVPGAGEPCWWR